MRIPWPITILAVLVTAGICVIGVIQGTVQAMPTGAAPSWWDFIASNALRVAFPTLIVGVIAWIIERNIKRARRTTDEYRGFDVVHQDDDRPPAA